MNVLVTGGAGYIGSHVAAELFASGHGCVIADNLSNSKADVIDKIFQISSKRPVFYKCDLMDRQSLDRIFAENKIDAVIHMAGFKAVGESVKKPLLYYRNNLDITINLLDSMLKHGCKSIVFSSSATVYGQPDISPVAEDAPLRPANPYGHTKLMNEQILRDAGAAYGLFVALLRYFNPIGAHPSGLIGENPNDTPNNLAPYVLKVVTGELPHVNVFGNDYQTPDGTGVRDYIHVCDLARGHILALGKLSESAGTVVYNLGTGRGQSVLEVIEAFSKAAGKPLPYVFAPRRAGDVDLYFADPAKAKRELGFECRFNLFDMARDSVNYALQQRNAR